MSGRGSAECLDVPGRAGTAFTRVQEAIDGSLDLSSWWCCSFLAAAVAPVPPAPPLTPPLAPPLLALVAIEDRECLLTPVVPELAVLPVEFEVVA